MGEQKQKKLTYEELSQKFGELFSQYQKATDYIQKLQTALNEESFNRASFFISMLFKVMEHPEMYSDEFVKWAQENIETSLRAFAETFDDSGNNDEGNVENDPGKPENKR